MWIKNKYASNYVLDNRRGKVFLSYQPNEFSNEFSNEYGKNLDSGNPETAIVLINDKKLDKKKVNRYLIFRGDKRAELEPLYPNIKKLKDYWKKYGGHFWSDNLSD